MAARKTKKVKTNEETLQGWIDGAVKGTYGHASLQRFGWEPGQVVPLTIDGVNYEKLEVPEGYVVIEWDTDGNLVVL